MISNLQVCRGLAALGVVLYHTAHPIFGRPLDFGGVAVFFVLSGFIVTYVTRRDAHSFLGKRLIRVVPVYWIATLLFFVYVGFGLNNPMYTLPMFAGLFEAGWVYFSHNVQLQGVSLLESEKLAYLTKSLLFVPEERHPVLGIGWTLNIEMFFYLIFGLALLVSRTWAPLLTCAAILTVRYLADVFNCGPVCVIYGHDYTAFFVGGVLIFYVWRAAEPVLLHWRKTSLAAAAFLATAFVILNVVPVAPSYLQHLLVPISLIAAALVAHTAGVRIENRLLIILGAASYSLYLTHPFVTETARTVAASVPALDPSSNPVAAAGVIALSVAVAVAFHYGVERPVTDGLRRALTSARSPEFATPRAASSPGA